MNNNTVPDNNVRERIRNELNVNMLVEAGAGSGKTTSMVSRMVSLVASGKCKVEKYSGHYIYKKSSART